jgi:hypothetical protein
MNQGNRKGQKEVRKKIAWQIASELAAGKQTDPVDMYEKIMEDFEDIDRENESCKTPRF